MDGYPIDHIPDRPCKRDQKHILKEMGGFADFCTSYKALLDFNWRARGSRIDFGSPTIIKGAWI